jgi:hypothetical protein
MLRFFFKLQYITETSDAGSASTSPVRASVVVTNVCMKLKILAWGLSNVHTKVYKNVPNDSVSHNDEPLHLSFLSKVWYETVYRQRKMR